jgi:hypothetical protein
MGIRYHIDHNFGVTFVRWSGLVTANDFLAHTSRLYSDVAWPPEKHLHFTDLREARLDRSITQDLLFKIAEMYRRHPKSSGFKVAVLASNLFKEARAFQRALHPPVSMIVFSEFSTACTWLGVPRTHAERRLRALQPIPACVKK